MSKKETVLLHRNEMEDWTVMVHDSWTLELIIGQCQLAQKFKTAVEESVVTENHGNK
jgi:hypothetical protein